MARNDGRDLDEAAGGNHRGGGHADGFDTVDEVVLDAVEKEAFNDSEPLAMNEDVAKACLENG